MIKPKNKQDLIDMLRSKTFKVLMVEEDEPKKLAEQVKKLQAKSTVTVIVLE
jgi:ABC-type Zn uptake system ZnuABC Zn-binding protein ZnuA